MYAQPSIAGARAAITVFVSVAVILTAFRLQYRWRIHRLWWDDAWAGISMLFEFVLITGFWIRTDVPGVGPLNQPRHVRAVAYWFAATGFTIVLWTARMSMLFSVIRIIPHKQPLRRFAFYCAALFVGMWAALLCQKIYICGRDTSWMHLSVPQCHLGKHVGITELVTDFVADTILVLLPLRLLWNINLPYHMRRLLLLIFSASILVTVVSIIHAVYLFSPAGILEGMTANIEDSVSLIVANLAVVVTHFHRLIRGDIDHIRYDGTTPTTGSGTLQGIAKHSNMKPKIGSTHFPLSPQSLSGQGTSSSADKSIPSNIDALAFSPDLSDDQLQEAEKASWEVQDEEANIPRSPARVIITRETVTASEHKHGV